MIWSVVRVPYFPVDLLKLTVIFQDCGKRFVTINLMKQHEITKHDKIELGKHCSSFEIIVLNETMVPHEMIMD